MRGGRSFYEKKALILFADSVIAYIGGGYLLLCFLLSQKVISGCRSADICVKFPGLVRGRKTLPIERVSSMGRTGWFIRKRWVTLTVAFFRTDRWCIPYMN